VSQSSDDIAARGRAIFRRLRSQSPSDGDSDEGDSDEGSVDPDDAATPAEALTVAGDGAAAAAMVESAGAEEPETAPATAAGPDASPAPVDTASQPAPESAAPESSASESSASELEGSVAGSPAVGPPSDETAPEPDPEPEPGPSAPEDDETERAAAPPSVGPAPGPLPGLQDLPSVPGMADPQLAGRGETAPVPPAEPAGAEPAGVVPAEPAPSPFARPLPRVMAIANQKGGVGKTTTAVNLGACLADRGYRVLVVDLDPQGNASTGMGVNIRDLQGSMYDVVLHDLPIEDCVEATSVRNLFCAPSSLELAGAEIELVPAFSREMRLKKALDEVKDDYDFVLIDCPPSLGLLTVNAFAAATEVVVPIQCEYYALEGLGQLLRNVNLVQKNLNPALELSAIILVMYDARTKLADQVVNEVREHFGDKVCRQVVPRTVRLSEAPSFGQPIIAFDSSSRGAIAYRELAKEVSGGTPQRAR
jgi:chromosome partitioning protein